MSEPQVKNPALVRVDNVEKREEPCSGSFKKFTIEP